MGKSTISMAIFSSDIHWKSMGQAIMEQEALEAQARVREAAGKKNIAWL